MVYAGVRLVTDVLLIDLGGCDMVLGVQWLTTLGPIYWDFKELLMKFDVDGCPFLLKGVHPQKVKLVQGAPFAKMLSATIELFLLHVRDVDVMLIMFSFSQ